MVKQETQNSITFLSSMYLSKEFDSFEKLIEFTREFTEF